MDIPSRAQRKNLGVHAASVLGAYLPRLQARAQAAKIAFVAEPALERAEQTRLRDQGHGLPPTLVEDLCAVSAVAAGFQIGGVRISLTQVAHAPAAATRWPRGLFPSRLELSQAAGRYLILADLSQPRLIDCSVYAVLVSPPLVIKLADRFDTWLGGLARFMPSDSRIQRSDWQPFQWSSARLRWFERRAKTLRAQSRDRALRAEDWTMSAWSAELSKDAWLIDFRQAKFGDAFYWSLHPPYDTFCRHPSLAMFALWPLLGGRGLWSFLSGSRKAELDRCQHLLAQGAIAEPVPWTRPAAPVPACSDDDTQVSIQIAQSAEHLTAR